MNAKKIILLITLVSAVAAKSQSLNAHSPMVMECEQAVKTRPQVGNRYRGFVTNDDYRFSARIPRGLTAWGGVARQGCAIRICRSAGLRCGVNRLLRV